MWSFNLSRGGTSLIYDNVFKAVSVSAASPLYHANPVYRHPTSGSCQDVWENACDNTPEKICLGYLKPCSGDSDCTEIPGDVCVNIDGQEDSSGYPCRDQFGTDVDWPYMTEQPVVAWNNKYCTSATDPLNCTANTYCRVTWASSDDSVVKVERNVIQYNSIAGTGDCEDGVDNDGDGYTDMDDPECSSFWDATNHKRKNYTAYTYPHPLTTGLSAPTRLAVVDKDTFSGGSVWTKSSGKTYTYYLTSREYGGKTIKTITEDGARLDETASVDLCESTSGSYFLDASDGTLYVHCTDGADPDAHTIEVYYH